MNRKNTPRKLLKLIAVDENNYNRLRQYGRTPQSFNDIVGILLDRVAAVSAVVVPEQQKEKKEALLTI